MDPIPKSGYYYANKIALLALNELEGVVGRNGLNAILRMACLPDLIDHPPADNLAKEFDFADFTAINIALEDMYGKRGSQGIAMRAGRIVFDNALRNFGALAGIGDVAFKALPMQTKLKIGIPAMAKICNQMSDENSVAHVGEDTIIYTIHHCPQCWTRSGLEEPVCFMGSGLLQAGLKWISGSSEFVVYESKCSAMGDDRCEYTISKAP